MTREEAKEFLITISYSLGNMAIEYLTEKVGEEMREAIKALEQEPCDDAISRQAAIEAVKQAIYNHDSAIMRLTELPPVTPQQKTGHWEWVQYGANPRLGNWHCSECRCVVVECIDKEEKGDIPLYKYCPQCGCRIVEPQESEESE